MILAVMSRKYDLHRRGVEVAFTEALVVVVVVEILASAAIVVVAVRDS